jgi:predicted transcriptional regulator of viral defense system
MNEGDARRAERRRNGARFRRAGAARARTFRQRDWVDALRSGKGVYRLAELARLAGHSEPSARQAARRLVERGWLARLGKSLWANLLRPEGPPTVEEVAAVLYPPSYVSLASALFEHGIAEQAPHVLTCVTTNKTKRFRTGLGEIHYHQILPALFFGYSLTRGVARAHAEKAILDTLYLELRAGRSPAVDEWNWEELDLDRLRSWAQRYPSTVMAMVSLRLGPIAAAERSALPA